MIKMKIEFNKIYRVVCTDNYQSTHPETYWCTDKQACQDYINKSYLSIAYILKKM